MKQAILLFFLTALPVLAHAQCSGNACLDVIIKEMQINVGEGDVWVQTSGTETSLNCTPNAGVFLYLNTASVGGNNVFDVLLSAQTMDKTITIRIEDNVSPCRIVYVVPK